MNYWLLLSVCRCPVVRREKHSRRLQTRQDYVSYQEEMGSRTLPEGQERAVSHHVSTSPLLPAQKHISKHFSSKGDRLKATCFSFQSSLGGDGSGEGGGAAGAGQHHLQQHSPSVLQLQMIHTHTGPTLFDMLTNELVKCFMVKLESVFIQNHCFCSSVWRDSFTTSYFK